MKQINIIEDLNKGVNREELAMRGERSERHDHRTNDADRKQKELHDRESK